MLSQTDAFALGPTTAGRCRLSREEGLGLCRRGDHQRNRLLYLQGRNDFVELPDMILEFTDTVAGVGSRLDPASPQHSWAG